MGKINKILLALVATLFGGFAIGAMDAGAAAEATWDNSKKSIVVKREVDNAQNNVTNTFTYKIERASGSGYSTTAATISPTTFTIPFENVAPTSGTATATKTVDLSAFKFTEVGDYVFKITETASSNSTAYPVDSDASWYFYVSVRNVVDANNTPTGALTASATATGTTSVVTANNGTVAGKAEIVFEENANLTYVEIAKQLKGTTANTDEYFKFTVKINGTGLATDKYTVTGADSGHGSATQCSFNVDCVVYIKGSQTIKIGQTSDGKNQIPVGAKWTVTEAADDDYTVTVNGASNATLAETTVVATGANDFATKNKATYVNEKNEDVLTGIFVNYWPFIVLAILGGVGIVALKFGAKGERKR
ncbi:hypothetical protein IKF15_03170 [Candidatus Saccharibacteria bacterium]|nr:hypothetical protein [Candidatus Saccharibacteria bacterium]